MAGFVVTTEGQVCYPSPIIVRYCREGLARRTPMADLHNYR